MNLTVESAARLACSEEVASLSPEAAAVFERCMEARRGSGGPGRSSGGRCRAGCPKGGAEAMEAGRAFLRVLAASPDRFAEEIKVRVGCFGKLRFSVDGTMHER